MITKRNFTLAINAALSLMQRYRLALGRRVYGSRDWNFLINELSAKQIDSIRSRALEKVKNRSNNTVLHGPFKGLRFLDVAGWSALDRAGMILGLYEKEVQERLAILAQIRDRSALLIDVGGGDGFYCIGALKANLFGHVICFETSPQQRKYIEDLAILNGVRNRLTLMGHADSAIASQVKANMPENFSLDRAVLLIDIEGHEYSLFDMLNASHFSSCSVIIEIHKWADPSGALRSQMRATLENYFNIEEFSTGPRAPFMPELEDFSDNERWLICSEQRRLSGVWWQLHPLSGWTASGSPHADLI